MFLTSNIGIDVHWSLRKQRLDLPLTNRNGIPTKVCLINWDDQNVIMHKLCEQSTDPQSLFIVRWISVSQVSSVESAILKIERYLQYFANSWSTRNSKLSITMILDEVLYSRDTDFKYSVLSYVVCDHLMDFLVIKNWLSTLGFQCWIKQIVNVNLVACNQLVSFQFNIVDTTLEACYCLIHKLSRNLYLRRNLSRLKIAFKVEF